MSFFKVFITSPPEKKSQLQLQFELTYFTFLCYLHSLLLFQLHAKEQFQMALFIRTFSTQSHVITYNLIELNLERNNLEYDNLMGPKVATLGIRKGLGRGYGCTGVQRGYTTSHYKERTKGHESMSQIELITFKRYSFFFSLVLVQNNSKMEKEEIIMEYEQSNNIDNNHRIKL